MRSSKMYFSLGNRYPFSQVRVKLVPKGNAGNPPQSCAFPQRGKETPPLTQFKIVCFTRQLWDLDGSGSLARERFLVALNIAGLCRKLVESKTRTYHGRVRSGREDDPEGFQGGGFKPNLKPFGFGGGGAET